jgi:hypothetical protein
VLVDEIIERVLRKNGAVDGFNCALFGKVTRDAYSSESGPVIPL